jgi:tetratricopeptide (TPR) repeat protein
VPFKLTAANLSREFGDRPLLIAVRFGLRVVTALGGLSIAASGQEPSSDKDFAPSAARPAVKTDQGRKAIVARPVPDALKFANGLLRQKKYDLAAEEYERFIKSGANGQDLDDGRFGLANARLYQGNFRDARAAFDEFLKGAAHDPRRLTARYRLGELAYLLGDLRARVWKWLGPISETPASGFRTFRTRGSPMSGRSRHIRRGSLPNERNMVSGGRWLGLENETKRRECCRSSPSKRSLNGSTGPGCKSV